MLGVDLSNVKTLHERTVLGNLTGASSIATAAAAAAAAAVESGRARAPVFERTAVAVVGGTGRLGQEIVNALLQSGVTRVRVIVRPGSTYSEGLEPLFPQADRIMAGYTGTYVEKFEACLMSSSDRTMDEALEGCKGVIVAAMADDSLKQGGVKSWAFTRDNLSPGRRSCPESSALERLAEAAVRSDTALLHISAAPAASKALSAATLRRKRREEGVLRTVGARSALRYTVIRSGAFETMRAGTCFRPVLLQVSVAHWHVLDSSHQNAPRPA